MRAGLRPDRPRLDRLRGVAAGAGRRSAARPLPPGLGRALRGGTARAGHTDGDGRRDVRALHGPAPRGGGRRHGRPAAPARATRDGDGGYAVRETATGRSGCPGRDPASQSRPSRRRTYPVRGLAAERGGRDRRPPHEDPRQSARRRRRRRRHRHRLRPGEGRLGRRDAAGARRADLRLDVARGGPAALLQHGLRHEPHPRPLDQVLQDAGGGDRPQPRLLRRRATCAWRRRQARMDEYVLYASTGRDGRRAARMADARGDRGTAGRWSAPTTSRARSSIPPTATSTRPTSRWRWPRARASAASTIERRWQVDGYDVDAATTGT